jgi:mono/diheme cytochrome c family protein
MVLGEAEGGESAGLRLSAAIGAFWVGVHGLWAGAPVSAERQDPVVTVGRKMFVERCAGCHGERGEKPLSKGPPLAERRLTRAALLETVAGRLADASADQREAVARYIQGVVAFAAPPALLTVHRANLAEVRAAFNAARRGPRLLVFLTST